jgi:hypothetical protein
MQIRDLTPADQDAIQQVSQLLAHRLARLRW